MSMGNAAVRKPTQDKPFLLMGGPMCGPFGAMNDLNYVKMMEGKDQKISYVFNVGRFVSGCMKYNGVKDVISYTDALKLQALGKRSVRSMLRRQRVVRVTGDQCRYGLTSNDGQSEGIARKRAGSMTNSPCIAKKLSLRCPNTKEHSVHDQVILINERAKAAAVYPPALCRAVCIGLTEQIDADRKGQFLISSVNVDESSDAKQMATEANSINEKHKTVEEDNNEELEIAWDDVSGADLDPKAAGRARAEEIECVQDGFLYKSAHHRVLR